MALSLSRTARGASLRIDSIASLSVPVQGKHVLALDGLRGLAVLMVVVFHVFQVEPIPTQSLARVFYLMTRLGQTGVDLFFVLSGFLITGILFDAKGSDRYFVNFYGRRTVRIFPLYYGVLVVSLVILPICFGVHLKSVAPIWLWTYTANLPIAFGADGGSFGYFWTLAIEEQFYLIWPAVVFLAGRKLLMRICLGCIAMAVLARMVAESVGVSSFSFTLCRMDSLTLGAFLALMIRRPEGARGLGKVAMGVILATVVVMAPCYAIKSGGGDAWVQVVKYTVTAAFYGALLILAITVSERSRLGRVFAFGPLRGVGRLSYGMYIYHSFAIHIAAAALSSARLATLGIAPTAALWLRFGLVIALSIAVSWLSWHLFERPFLVLKKYFVYRPGPRPVGYTSPRRETRLILGAD
jgi:peptidoglycan/LPS O-acetylase OafA/YrhL